MSTIDERWNVVDVTRAFCQKILPLVYDESLSYMEMVCKMSSKLNEIIENNNNLPKYIKELIEEIVNSEEFTQIVGSVLMNTIINVKFPPEGISPARGDGIIDDTKSIQDCLDYANAHGGAVVFFPSGKYLTGTLTMAAQTSILGADRYSSSLILKGGGSTPLLRGVISQSVRNIHLDGNRLNQIEENYLIDGDIENALFDCIILSDSAHCITSEKCNSNEFCNIKVVDIGDNVFIDAMGSDNLLTNINTKCSIFISGDNNNWQSAKQTKIENEEAIIYQSPQKLNEYFNYITMQNAGNEYKVLVEGENTDLDFDFDFDNNSQLTVYRIGRFLEERPGFISNTSNAYGTPQGACMLNGIITQALLKQDNDCKFKKFNALTGETLSETVVANLGHSSTLFYYDNKIIVTNGLNKKFYVLDYNNYALLETHDLSYGASENLVAVLRDDEHYYMLNTTQLIVCDANLNLVQIYQLPEILKPMQSATLHNNFIYIINSNPETITKINLQGQLIDSYLLPFVTNNKYFTGELESINFYGDDCYLTSFSSSGVYQPLWFTNVLAANLDHDYLYPNYLDNNIGYSGNSTVYIDTSKNSYNPNGSISTPFKTLGEAISYIQTNPSYTYIQYQNENATDYILFTAHLPNLTIIGKDTKFKDIQIDNTSATIRNCILDHSILSNYNVNRHQINYSKINFGNLGLVTGYPAINVTYSDIYFTSRNDNYASFNDNNNIYFNLTGSNFKSNFLLSTIVTDQYTTSEFIVKESITRIGDTSLKLVEPYNSNPSYFDAFDEFKCQIVINKGGFYDYKFYNISKNGAYFTESLAGTDGIIIGTFFFSPANRRLERIAQYKISTSGSVSEDTTNFIAIRKMWGYFN